jgi:hypothetical protein
MPPRFAYWTIILDGTPTSFRTKEREEILPLFNQLKAKNPSALLKWFSGGTLWDSPEQAREAREREKVRAFRETRTREQREQTERPWSPGSSPRPFDGLRAAPSKVEGRQGSGQAGPGAPKARGEDVDDPLAEFRRQHGRPADGSDDPSTLRQAQGRPEQGRGATRGGSPHALRAGPSFPQGDDARPRMKRPWSPGSSTRQGSGHAGPGAPRRGKDWRPGGEHRDPADRYKLPPGEARKRWKERNLGPRGPKPVGPKPGGDRPWSDRPRGPKPFGSKPPGDRPWNDKRGGPPSTLRPAQGRPEQGRGATRGGDDRSLRPGKPFGSKPGGRPFGGRPRGHDKPPGGPRGKR